MDDGPSRSRTARDEPLMRCCAGSVGAAKSQPIGGTCHEEEFWHFCSGSIAIGFGRKIRSTTIPFVRIKARIAAKALAFGEHSSANRNEGTSACCSALFCSRRCRWRRARHRRRRRLFQRRASRSASMGQTCSSIKRRMGPGTTPPEGHEFAHGSPISPMSPYDWFSSAPVTPGVAGIAQYEISGTYHATGVDFAATFGIGGLTGSTTNALYWSEPLDPELERSRSLAGRSVRNRFSDASRARRRERLQREPAQRFGRRRGRQLESAGRLFQFDAERSVRLCAAADHIGRAVGRRADRRNARTRECRRSTRGPRVRRRYRCWAPTAFGVRAARRSSSPTRSCRRWPNTNVRLTMGSLVLDRGDYGRFSLQLAHLWSTGDPILDHLTSARIRRSIPVRWDGSSPATLGEPGADDRRRARVRPSFERLGCAGRARARMVRRRLWSAIRARRITETTNISVWRVTSAATSRRSSIHRFDPTYATMILPYGIPENVWSVAWSWPGVWLKSTYQLVDNSVIGANRAGFHFRVRSQR